MTTPRATLTRRLFIQRTSGAALAGAVFPSLAPASVFGAEGKVAPGNRITVGCIGTGPQGTSDMLGFLGAKDAQVVAVCDVKQEQVQQARDEVNKAYQNQDCAAYEDFRELLARKDIDACLIGTPDHWHVPISIAAVKAGKDIYTEKPLGCSLAEDQALRTAVHEHKRIFQFGTQQRSDRRFRTAATLVRNGRLGKLKHINVWSLGSAPGGSTKEIPVPPTMNYDLWLGPAPFKPLTENRSSGDGRKKTWWFETDYALGFLAGWGIHPMDIAIWGAGDGMRGTVEVEGTGSYPTTGACNTATVWDLNYTFSTGVTMTFVGLPNGGNARQPTGEVWAHETEWRQKYGALVHHGTAFEGADGWCLVDRRKMVTQPESLTELKTETLPVQLKVSSDHVRDFLDSIKSRQPAIAHVDDAVWGDTLCHIGDIAARLKRKVTFDFGNERFTGDDEANKRLGLRAMRLPWHL